MRPATAGPFAAAALALFAVVALPALAGPPGGIAPAASNWPQWRGPARDGTAALPAAAAWAGMLQKAWTVEVGSGHAGPVTMGDDVFVFEREGDEERLRSLSIADGKTRWQTSYSAPYTMHPAATGHGPGPKATPVVAGGRVFTLGIGGILSSVDAANGKVLWRKDFAGEYPVTSPLFGSAASPLVVGERVIVAVGGSKGGALAAFDVATGDPVWRWSGDGPGYSSPMIATFDGVSQVVVQTADAIVGVAVADGSLLWQRAFSTPYQQNSVTPVMHGDTVILSGLEQGTFALRPRRDGAAWKAEEVWRNAEVGFYMNTPVPVGDRLCGLDHHRHGRFACLDPGTGALLWTTEGRDGEHATTLASPQVLLQFTTAGELQVFDPAKAFALTTRIPLAAAAVWAHPAVAADLLLVRDANTLTAWRLPGGAGAHGSS